MSETLLVGMARRDITPPPGEPMAAFPEQRDPLRPRVAAGVRDPLFARALALGDGDRALVVCAADVLAFQWPDVDWMRREFHARTDAPAESLIVCATHNHNGPECTYLFGGSPDAPAIQRVRSQTVAAAVEAFHARRPARVRVGAVAADLAYNRRFVSPDGRFHQRSRNPERERVDPVDPRVSVLRFDWPDHARSAAALHFAAHPVILHTPNRRFTAEYPGAALRRFLARTDAADAMFLQGAAGDVHPWQALTNDDEGVEEMGEGLARAGADAWRAASPVDAPRVRVERSCFSLPHRYAAGRRVRVEVAAASLSSRLALVFLQGEPFVEHSLSLQWRSPFARTIVVGYALGWIGYVPTRQAYEWGGYGVDQYDCDPPGYSRTSVPPGAGERLVDEAAALLERLRAAAG